MRKWTLIAAACVLAGSAWARLGETPEECAKRYGPVLREATEGEMKIQEFKKSGIRVRVYFALKKETLFAYAKAVGIVYSKPTPSGVQNQELSQNEIKTLLDANSQGEPWQEIDLIKQAAETEPGTKQAQLIHDAGKFLLWTRKSGAKAQYLKKTHHLVIRTTAQVPLPKEKEPEHLEGF